jgi:hypothetical protein
MLISKKILLLFILKFDEFLFLIIFKKILLLKKLMKELIIELIKSKNYLIVNEIVLYNFINIK